MWYPVVLFQLHALVSEESHTNSFIDNMFWKRNVFWKHNLSSPWYSSVRSCITTSFPVVPEHSKSKTGYSNRYCQKKRFLPVSNMTHRNRNWGEGAKQFPVTFTVATAHISSAHHRKPWKMCFNETRTDTWLGRTDVLCCELISSSVHSRSYSDNLWSEL